MHIDFDKNRKKLGTKCDNSYFIKIILKSALQKTEK